MDIPGTGKEKGEEFFKQKEWEKQCRGGSDALAQENA